MMLAYRLVRLIETHSERLANALQERIDNSDRLQAYQSVPREEVTGVVKEVYRNLGEWLLGKTEADVETRYTAIGAKRFAQGVPQSQLIWTIALVKENLWQYLQKESVLERPVEVFGSLEMLELLDQFFDRATFYAALGYEEAQAAQAEEPVGTR